MHTKSKNLYNKHYENIPNLKFGIYIPVGNTVLYIFAAHVL